MCKTSCRMRWMSNVKLEKRISREELRTRLKLKRTKEFLQCRGLHWFAHLKKMKESALSSKC